MTETTAFVRACALSDLPEDGALGVELQGTPVAIIRADGEVFLIPIDLFYSLVGELRLLWQGFDGGAEVRAALAEFLAGLRRRAVIMEREH